jgi:hypothetical protein
VRATASGERQAEVRTEEGPVVPLPPPYSGRLPARPVAHRVELWLPGADRPATVARYWVRE